MNEISLFHISTTFTQTFMLACTWNEINIHITSPCFVAVDDLLNSTKYSEKLHFSIEVPI